MPYTPYTADAPIESVGTRIRELRTLRGYSLRELGQRAHVSISQLSRVENGDRDPSPAIGAAVARALGVTMPVLYGQPYAKMLRHDELDRLIAPIGAALDAWDVPLGEGDPPPRSLGELESEVAALSEQRAAAEYFEIAQALPGLLAEVGAHVLTVRPGRDLERAAWLQAELCRTVSSVGRHLGFLDLARLGLSRMAVAARQSGDPRQVAIERWDRAQVLADAARPGHGALLLRQALRDLDDDGQRATRAVRGSLRLKGAILAGRSGDAGGAEEWLAAAEEIAGQTGETSDYGLVFGPVNVTIHRMSAASDRDRHVRALEKAREVRLPEDYPPQRAAYYWIDRARAEAWAAHHDEAFTSLKQAKAVAPQLARYHHSVHETVAALLRARQRASDPLREFAAWSGV
jgi:transcriptional regulator with XRE-family HTH domain